MSVIAWRGERIGLEAVIQTDRKADELSLQIRARNKTARKWDARADFLGWVLTDSFNTCGQHPDNLKPFLVPDVIGGGEQKAEKGVLPVWCTIEVPYDCKSGNYRWQLEVSERSSGRLLTRLPLRLQVLNHTLPRPSQQELHLDFWQQPYSVSRYHNVPRWSQQHFDLLRPYLKLLARAGQSVISAILFYEPWGEQSNDKFDAMIKTTREKDGSWSYDYTVFDHWVELCDSCGLGPQINCFSMVPWDMSFRYFDAFSQQYIDLKTTTNSEEYRELWSNFLKAFAQHLKAKGWIHRTCIAMDERGLSSMLDAWNVAQTAAPELKMALAGNHHPELADKLYDYCIAYGQQFTPEEQQYRKKQGLVSTTYTCCSEQKPNTFTNSQPIEAVYTPLYTVANGFDGYLHWSWMNWTDNPLTDSRFKLFAPGDTYLIYPGPCSSVRWERFIEGVQLAEKVLLLRKDYERHNNQSALQSLNEALAAFKSTDPGSTEEIASKVKALKQLVSR
ncbi:MAG: DUF4091 domain-containing protein [Prevotella sp.]|nr:DUF4091 domain-containing protein [Prevotella sp.]